jgi:hypothetical protein
VPTNGDVKNAHEIWDGPKLPLTHVLALRGNADSTRKATRPEGSARRKSSGAYRALGPIRSCSSMPSIGYFASATQRSAQVIMPAAKVGRFGAAEP